MSISRRVIIITTLVLSLTACSATTPVVTETAIPLTTAAPGLTTATALPAASPTASPTRPPTATPMPTPTNTRVPTITPTSSPTPTPEPEITISETLTTTVNVRSGPGTDYPTIGQFKPGQTALVTGRNADTSWWQVSLTNTRVYTDGWIYSTLVAFSGDSKSVPIVKAPPLPTPIPETKAETKSEAKNGETLTPEELADKLRCGKDFCVTYQALIPIWENGGCRGNHSIYITVLQGLPPGQPMDGVVVGDTYNNVEVASGSHGPGRTEITLWNNSMTLIVKRNIDGTPYTSQESFNFTAHDELIPADVLAASGYCEGNVEKCEYNRNHNSVCRGHYSWRVTFHKFD